MLLMVPHVLHRQDVSATVQENLLKVCKVVDLLGCLFFKCFTSVAVNF